MLLAIRQTATSPKGDENNNRTYCLRASFVDLLRKCVEIRQKLPDSSLVLHKNQPKKWDKKTNKQEKHTLLFTSPSQAQDGQPRTISDGSPSRACLGVRFEALRPNYPVTLLSLKQKILKVTLYATGKRFGAKIERSPPTINKVVSRPQDCLFQWAFWIFVEELVVLYWTNLWYSAILQNNYLINLRKEGDTMSDKNACLRNTTKNNKQCKQCCC